MRPWPTTTKDGELVNDETEAPADNNGGSSEVDFDGDEQFLEDDSIELMGELSGKAYNTVTIWAAQTQEPMQ